MYSDPPIRWEEVKTKADHRKWIAMRETFPADVVRREVLAKHRRALLVYGVGHLWRKNAQANFESTGMAASLVSLREETHGAQVFNVGLTLDPDQDRPDVASWPVPSLIVLRGTDMGAMVSPALCADPTYVEMRTGRMALAEWKSDRLEDYCGKVAPSAK